MNGYCSIKGKVKKGKNRGKNLGFPTANVNLRKKIPEGIYISKTKIKGKAYNSLTFIGKAKTYNENLFQAETFIFDFNKPLYDSWISIFLIKKIRENKKFNSEKELIKQMEEDKKIAGKYFNLKC
ncbi:hypothetical protein C4559_01340 [Candidatus Microgenomates bacterium]|nr:MAG: hypothetical protein C4559_01340 [Candidatus Microgenomates bacterium]